MSICPLLMYTVQTFATPANPSPRNPPRRRRRIHPHKNDLLRLYTADVAEQLSLFEFKLYAKVTPQECIRHATTSSSGSENNLSLFCGTHDKLAAWVKTSILNNHALGKRAETIDFWIKVAEVSVRYCAVNEPISHPSCNIEMQTTE
jgi:son of sevenless